MKQIYILFVNVFIYYKLHLGLIFITCAPFLPAGLTWSSPCSSVWTGRWARSLQRICTNWPTILCSDQRSQLIQTVKKRLNKHINVFSLISVREVRSHCFMYSRHAVQPVTVCLIGRYIMENWALWVTVKIERILIGGSLKLVLICPVNYKSPFIND